MPLQLDPAPLRGRVEDAPPALLGISVISEADTDGTFRIGPEDSLTLQIVSGVPGRLRVEIGFLNERGEAHWEADQQIAERSVDIEVPCRAIAISTLPTNHSGYAIVRAMVDPAEGPRREGALGIWFHPDKQGRWVLYDDVVRAQIFDDGLLSDEAPSLAAGDEPPTTAYVRDEEPLEDPEEAEAGDHDR